MFKIHKNAFAAWTLPLTPLGKLTVLHQTHSWINEWSLCGTGSGIKNNNNNLNVMCKYFVCLSVIPLCRLLCCTVSDPDCNILSP